MQMRDYTVKPGCLDDYVKAWTDRIYPLRLNHGFRIDGAWVARAENRFFWTLAYDGPEDWSVKNDAYDRVRQQFDPDPARLLAVEHKIVVDRISLDSRS